MFQTYRIQNFELKHLIIKHLFFVKFCLHYALALMLL